MHIHTRHVQKIKLFEMSAPIQSPAKRKVRSVIRTKQMGSKLKFLTRYAQEGDEFLESIVTGNEIWVFSPHSWIQATVTVMAPCAFPQNQKIGGILYRRCHFKHYSLKQCRFYHCSQVKDQGRRQCCHNKHKNIPIGLHVMYLYFPDTPRS